MFTPVNKTAKELRRRLAHGRGYEQGFVRIDEGAATALKSKSASLLPVGILEVKGQFGKGALIGIQNSKGEILGYGLASSSAIQIRKNIGKHDKKAAIHYDHLVLNN